MAWAGGKRTLATSRFNPRKMIRGRRNWVERKGDRRLGWLGEPGPPFPDWGVSELWGMVARYQMFRARSARSRN